MNILLFCFEYPPIGGGGGVGAQQYAEAWVSQGHDVMVLTGLAEGLASQEMVNGVEVVRVQTLGRQDRATSTFLSMLSYNFFGLFYVLAHRQELTKFVVINTHFSIPTGPLAWVAAKLLHIPNVLTIIGGDIYDPSKTSSPHRHALLRGVNRWVINGADHVIAISSDTKKRAETLYGIDRAIEVVNYGYMPRPACPPSETLELLNPNIFYLIAVGRLVKRKGFEFLIRAMKFLPQGIELLLVGDGPLEMSLRNLAEEEGVSTRVQILGFRTRDQIYHLLREADCFVLSSLHEGLGIVVQEAMDAGLPVVATDNGGQVDLIQYPRNGILVEAENAEALAKGVRAIFSNLESSKEMSENNIKDIQALHIETNCQRYIAAFQSTLHPNTLMGSSKAV